MKRITLSTIALLFAANICSANLHFGNDGEDLAGSSSMLKPFITGSEVHITTPIYLQDFGIRFLSSGFDAKAGVYSDNGGLPGTLLAETGTFTVTATGLVESPLQTVITLPVGDYWCMAVFNGSVSFRATVGIVDGGERVNSIAPGGVIRLVNFSDPLPSFFSPSEVAPQRSQLGFGPISPFSNSFYLVGEAVPEPSTLALLCLGGLGLIMRRRR